MGQWLRLAVLMVAALLCAATTVLHAQVCGVPGHQGLVTTASLAPNTYYAGTGTPGAGTNAITLATGANATRGVATNLLAGDLVLIIQMQDSSGSLEGNYEYAVVTVGGGVGATIQLGAPLANSYAQNVAAGTIRTFQVVRVPQYSAATLSGTVNVLPWYVDPVTGFGTGGVYAVDVAGALTMNGVTINAMGKGFRGGRGVNSAQNRAGGTPFDASYTCTPATLNGGFKGEGTEGIPQQVFGYNITGTAGGTLTYDAAGQLFNAGQGYPGGSCGQASLGNAGGGGNDGVPPAQTNGLNSGGGGGGNAGTGGIGGNSWNQNDNPNATYNNPTSAALSGVGGFDAGGRGGLGLSPAVTTRVYLGGGGGGGGSNNGTTDSVITFPPSNLATANGANGPLTSSGAPGGGMVLIRAGTIAVSAASTINAYGVRSYNKSPVGATDAAGGGGGGGTVIIDAPATASVANLAINAGGGIGGNSNYFNHGPGGGGGGGYVATSFTGATIDVAGGAAGTDGCCAGTAGNLSPKNYRAAAGANGTSLTGSAGVLPPGSGASARCLPNLTVTKIANTPAISAATGATASYTINVRNTGGAATNVFLFDTSLPPGWVYRTATPATTYAYSPAPPLAGGTFAAGAENTTAATVALPPALPITTLATTNSITAVALRADAAAPGRVSTAGQGSVTFGSFFVPQNGSISVTYGVTIPDTATVGTYHNPAGAIFLDPTRNVATARMVAMATDVNANRNTLSYSSNTSFQSGGTTTIPGSHHSGLVAGPTTDDVVLLADLSITKTASATATVNTAFTYTLVPRNNGRALGVQAYAATQATPLADGAAIGAAIGASPLTLTDTLPDGMRMTTTFVGTGWTCSGTATAVCTLPAATAFPRAAATNFPTLTGVVSATCGDSGAKLNTVQIQQATGALLTANNTGTALTTLSPACTTATLTISKTSSPTGILLTGSTVSYTLTVANLGPSNAPGAIVMDTPGAGLNCTAGTVSCTVLSGTASCPASPTVAALTNTGLTITPNFNAGSTVAFVVTCLVDATGL